MKNRLIGGAIICALVIPCFLIGGIVFDIFAGIIGILALYELFNANKNLSKVPTYMKILGLSSIPIIAFLNLSNSILVGLDLYTIVIPIVLLLIPSLFLHKKGYSMNEAIIMLGYSIFIGILTNIYISIFASNKMVLLYLIIIQAATDIFAYLGGRLLGKHKFSKISPNKTIEGCVIGSIFGTAAGFIFFVKLLTYSNSMIIFGLTLVLSIVGQLGDLVFSLIKRDNNIKDFSHIIPGHGGICDRLDSLSFIVLVFIILSRFL